MSLEYSVTKGQVRAREHSPPLRHRAEYNSGGTTPPQIYNKPHPNQNEPIKLNPVLSLHSRNPVDRLPPIEAIHGSPPISKEKRHSTDFLRPFHPPAPRHEPVMSHSSFHQNQQNHHHASSDRRESIDQSQRKMSLPLNAAMHERSSAFSDAIGRRPSLIDKPSMTTAAIPGALPIEEAALNRYIPARPVPNRRYYDIYHQTLPVLPHHAKRLHGYLAAAPVHLRNALLHSIYALTASDPHQSTPSSSYSPPPPPAHIEHTRKACDLLGMEAFVADERNTLSLSRNLLHMQILLLLALNADKRAFAAPRPNTSHTVVTHGMNERIYTSRFVGSMIGAAWGCANELKLCESNGIVRKRMHEAIESPEDSVGDLDGEECLSRRAWWILVILDRWRSASTSSMPLISDDKIYLKESDRAVLGDGPFHLVRLSCVFGHIAEVPNSTLSGETPLNLAQIARLLNGEVDRVRETAERTMSQDAILNIAFW